MTRIFISYRRDDSSRDAGRIYDRLLAAFGKDNVFKDVDSIPLGKDFLGILREAVAHCDVQLVIIGKQWLTITDETGNRRLDNPGDFVRIEVESALQSDSCLVIPVLVDSASMPPADDLPLDLRELVFKNATSVRDDPDFHNDVTRIIRSLGGQPDSKSAAPAAPPKPARPLVLDILPAPFAWVDIPAGKVKLEEGGYVPAGGQYFEVPAFAIARYPVTNAQFTRFIDAGGYQQKKWWTEAGWGQRETDQWDEPRYWADAKWNGPEQPVVGVSWYEVVAFCRWLSDACSENITLPTEQQWQRAAQGDDGRAYPWGSDWDGARCNNSVNPYDSNQTTSVHQFEGKGDSPFGVVDMAGNVWEWCLTAHQSGSIALGGTDVRVLRVGSWGSSFTDLFRCDFRNRLDLHLRGNDGGFRVSRS